MNGWSKMKETLPDMTLNLMLLVISV